MPDQFLQFFDKWRHKARWSLAHSSRDWWAKQFQPNSSERATINCCDLSSKASREDLDTCPSDFFFFRFPFARWMWLEKISPELSVGAVLSYWPLSPPTSINYCKCLFSWVWSRSAPSINRERNNSRTHSENSGLKCLRTAGMLKNSKAHWSPRCACVCWSVHHHCRDC